MNNLMNWLGAKAIALATLALFAAMTGILAAVVMRSFQFGWDLMQ